MSYTVLARKYRSVNFDELVGQEQIAKTLKRAIESGRIAHAYLFCGTRGTGKTSTARILAKALNCQAADKPTPVPCGKCDSCLSIARGDDIDVIEIDAASNTGVDNVREIIENSQYRPARSRFKVYIIDEVHMLSKSAFNALLKTLEEPPSHVKFILATTEPEKVLATILSRCQRYDFRNIPAKEIAAHLREICGKENIEAEPDALAMIAKVGAGSMRDALSLLDRLLSLAEKTLALADVERMLGLPRVQVVAELAGTIIAGDIQQTLQRIDAMILSGFSAEMLIAALSDHLRNLLIARTCGAESGLLDVPGISNAELITQATKVDAITLAQDIAILEELRRNLRQGHTARAMLDATLVRLAMSEQFTSIGELLGGGGKPSAPPVTEKKKPEPIAIPATATATQDEADDDDLPMPGKVWAGPSLKDALREHSSQASNSAPVPAPTPTTTPPASDEELWSRLLTLLAGRSASLSSALRMGTLAGIDGGLAIIRFPSDGQTFVKAWTSNGKRDQIAKAISELRGQPTGVRFDVAVEPEAPSPPPANSATSTPPPPRTAAEIAPPPVASRPSPQAIADAEADPLVQWALKEFGGTIRNVE